MVDAITRMLMMMMMMMLSYFDVGLHAAAYAVFNVVPVVVLYTE